MRVRIQDIPEEGSRVENALDAVWLSKALEGLASVQTGGHLSMSMERVGEKVLLRGRCAAELEVDCVRCLSSVALALEVPVVHVLEPKPELGAWEEEVELESDDMDVSYIEGPDIVLDDIIREHLILALPMNPHCREDCAGLCAACGGNKNEVSCGCVAVA